MRRHRWLDDLLDTLERDDRRVVTYTCLCGDDAGHEECIRAVVLEAQPTGPYVVLPTKLDKETWLAMAEGML